MPTSKDLPSSLVQLRNAFGPAITRDTRSKADSSRQFQNISDFISEYCRNKKRVISFVTPLLGAQLQWQISRWGFRLKFSPTPSSLKSGFQEALDGVRLAQSRGEAERLPNFVTMIDGLGIHFIHVRSQHKNALPLIVTTAGRAR